MQAGGENQLAIRKGPWKLIPGGPRGKRKPAAAELYNLADDLGETKNVAAEHPDVVRELTALLQKVRREDQSRP